MESYDVTKVKESRASDSLSFLYEIIKLLSNGILLFIWLHIYSAANSIAFRFNMLVEKNT